MMYIDLSKIDKNDTDVIKWEKYAQAHLETLSKLVTHEKRKEYLEKNNLWGDFKSILIRYFGEKCWYSECSLEGSFADVDHFRPKNKSTNENGKPILKDGYWWLAYDYNNYRLSCEKCNRRFGHGGKSDCFPLKFGSQPATYPQKKDEQLLLDPCDPDDYYLIDSDETGDIIAMSSNSYDIKRVEISKKIYNWKEFNGGRKKIRLECKVALERFEMHYNDNAKEMEYDIQQILLIIDPHKPYSSFAQKYIYRKISGKPYETIIIKILQSII